MINDEKIKLRVINIPINMKGELILDYKNTESLVISLYQKLRTLDVSEYIKGDTITAELDLETVNGVLKVNGIQVVGPQQPAIADVAGGGGDSDGTARSKINEIIATLRTHGLIIT